MMDSKRRLEKEFCWNENHNLDYTGKKNELGKYKQKTPNASDRRGKREDNIKLKSNKMIQDQSTGKSHVNQRVMVDR